ncbi:MAG: glucose-1-phosphate adenylyltransferase [Panacagrimonas sp.]
MNTDQDSRFVSRLTRDTLALVMAGGRGSRLMQMTTARAKPAVPFGGNYRIIDFTLSNCINSGIRRIGVLTQYKGSSLIRHLQQGWSFLRGQFGEFVELLPAEQRCENPSWYAGTADAVHQNADFVRAHKPALVLVLAGDHVYKMDYGPMLAHHVRSGAKVTVGCLEVPLNEASSFGCMQVDEQTRVTRWDEKPERPEPVLGKSGVALASMGIYVFDAGFLLQWLSRDARSMDSSHDFGKDVVPAAIARGGVYAYRFTDMNDPAKQGYWRDVGTIDAYWKANIELTAVTPEFNLYDSDWPVWTDCPQLPPAKFVFDRPSMRGSAADSLVSAGCIVSGARVRRSVMFVGSRAETGSIIDQTLLLPGAKVGRNCRIRKAVIDENCVVPDGLVIGEDPVVDARHFHVSDEGVTLVTPEMLRDVRAEPQQRVGAPAVRWDRASIFKDRIPVRAA